MVMGYEELVGKPAPSFTLKNHDGLDYEVKPGANGIPIVLIFYPKADTYVCTAQACQMRDALTQKDRWGPEIVQLIGISRSSVTNQNAFVEKYNLTYPALSDDEGVARQLYKIGAILLGFVDNRVTIVIDGKGIVRDTHDAVINVYAHKAFIEKWLATFAEESKSALPSTATPEAVKLETETTA